MKIFRPRTFLNLLVLGFIMVSLPLGVGLWTTLKFIDQLSGTGLEVVEHAVSGTRESELLAEHLRNEERTLRLYSITAEKEYLKQTEDYHAQIDTLLFQLLRLPLRTDVLTSIDEMRNTRNVQRTTIISARDGTIKGDPQAEITKAIESFEAQQNQVQDIRAGIQEMMEKEITGLKKTTEEAQHTLVTQTITFILATIFMIIVMTFLLSWPVRQLNKSVERLGNGDFKTPVLVSGPLDLEMLGEKLDWLRVRLEALEQEKAKFLAHISHELKTPLASIREGAALLNEGLVGELSHKQEAVTSILINNSVLLQDLIENIINFNMAQLKKESKESNKLINLKSLIEKVAQAQTTKIIGRNINLDIKLQNVLICGNQKELEAIFENLLSNAAKYSPPGGTIGCRLSSDKKKAACIIYDSGPGIPKEESEKIFKPFYQVETHVDSVVKGSGLGLAIVYEYVTHHRGSIRVLNPGEPGARFGITLPIDNAEIENQTKADENS